MFLILKNATASKMIQLIQLIKERNLQLQGHMQVAEHLCYWPFEWCLLLQGQKFNTTDWWDRMVQCIG